jgi:hypothetical protein
MSEVQALLVESKDGQILAGIDDLLVFLKTHARKEYGGVETFLPMFDHVIDDAMAVVKESWRRDCRKQNTKGE